MIWTILPHVTVCIADGRIILLDIRQDRYSQIPADLTFEMANWLKARENLPVPSVILALLRRSGTLRDEDALPSNTARDRVRIPTNLISPVWVRGKSTASVSIGMTMMSTWSSLRFRRLWDILREHHYCDVPLRRPSPDLFDLSARFERGRRFSPIARRCLVDTLALHSWLGEAGRECRIVFGVTAAPFRAHCWLQAPVGVLNDSFDHVSRFTPILSLRVLDAGRDRYHE